MAERWSTKGRPASEDIEIPCRLVRNAISVQYWTRRAIEAETVVQSSTPADRQRVENGAADIARKDLSSEEDMTLRGKASAPETPSAAE